MKEPSGFFFPTNIALKKSVSAAKWWDKHYPVLLGSLKPSEGKKHNYFSLTIHFLQITTFHNSVPPPLEPPGCAPGFSHKCTQGLWEGWQHGPSGVLDSTSVSAQPWPMLQVLPYQCLIRFEERLGLPGLSPGVAWLCWAVAPTAVVLLHCPVPVPLPMPLPESLPQHDSCRSAVLALWTNIPVVAEGHVPGPVQQ